jgi:hypothetical protein
MTEQALYRIEEMTTSGWHVVDPSTDHHLTKDQAKQRIDELIADEYNPNRLRVVRES